jgi:hypothetical protein
MLRMASLDSLGLSANSTGSTPRSGARGKPRSGAAGGSRYSTITVQRNLRYQRRAAVAKLANWQFKTDGQRSVFDRVGFCGRAMGGRVSIMSDGAKCWPTGVAVCGSVWLCPVCSAKIKARRAVEIEGLCDSHALVGGSFSMLTATVRHDRSQSLLEVRGAVASSWRKLQRRKSWADARAAMVGHVVAPEVTIGPNGWHPHLHVLFFVTGGVDSAAVDALLPALRSDWIELVNESLGTSPSIERGVNLVHFGADSTAAAAGYLSKVAKELTASDLKSGRDPFSLLDGVGEGDSEAIAKWFEFGRAMKGVRSVAFSCGLRDAYGASALDDVEVAELDEVAGVEVAWVGARTWNRALRDGAIGELLTQLESSLGVLLPLQLSSA